MRIRLTILAFLLLMFQAFSLPSLAGEKAGVEPTKAGPTKDFLVSFDQAKRYFQAGEYQKVIAALEKHMPVLDFESLEANTNNPGEIFAARDMLGKSYLRIGSLKKAFFVFQRTNSASDDSEPYALYMSALYDLLYGDFDVVEFLVNDKHNWLDSEHRTYLLLLSTLLRNDKNNIPPALQKLAQAPPGGNLSDFTRSLINYLLGRTDEEELLRQTPKGEEDLARLFMGLKAEKLLDLPVVAKKYYLQVYNHDREMYRWLAGMRLGMARVIAVKDSMYDWADNWVMIRSASTLFDRGNPYTVGNLWDRNYKTAWVEGKDDDGVGEWVEFSFDPGLVVKAVKIMNGYAKDWDRYETNGKVKRALLSFDNGLSFEVTFNNNAIEPRIVELPAPVRTERFRLTILEVYPGSKYHDTCITEITPILAN